jgi:hypothetical protein
MLVKLLIDYSHINIQNQFFRQILQMLIEIRFEKYDLQITNRKQKKKDIFVLILNIQVFLIAYSKIR